jgi:ElaB/YqjD/DUF883 family membrane-anchored ribosome-binding protein
MNATNMPTVPTKGDVKSGIDKAADMAKGAVEYGNDEAKKVGDKAKNAADQAGSTLGTIADKAEQYAQEGKQAIKHLASEAGEAGEKAQKWAGEAYDASAERLDNYTQDLSNMVRKYPVQSVLVGFLAGMLLSRTLRS